MKDWRIGRFNSFDGLDSDAEILKQLRTDTARQGLSHMLGFEVARAGRGWVELRAENAPQLRQEGDLFLAGGAGALCEAACRLSGLSAAAAASTPPGVRTLEYKVNVLAPGSGPRLWAFAHLIQANRRQAVASAHIFCGEDGDRQLSALAQATLAYI